MRILHFNQSGESGSSGDDGESDETSDSGGTGESCKTGEFSDSGKSGDSGDSILMSDHKLSYLSAYFQCKFVGAFPFSSLGGFPNEQDLSVSAGDFAAVAATAYDDENGDRANDGDPCDL